MLNTVSNPQTTQASDTHMTLETPLNVPELVWGTLVSKPVSVEHIRIETFVRDTTRYIDLDHPNLLKCLGFRLCEDSVDQISEEINVMRVFQNQLVRDEVHHRRTVRVAARFVLLWEDCGAFQDLSSYVRNALPQPSFVVMLDVALALRYLHTNGIVHGAVRSSNILLIDGGRAKLANLRFGRRCHKFKSRSRQFVTNDRWTAPEFLAGCGGNDVCASFSADVYGLGLCALELVTGEPAFGMMPDDDVVAILSDKTEYPRPIGMDLQLWDVLIKLLAHDPAQRPSIDEVVNEFGRLVGSVPLDTDIVGSY